MKVRQLKKNLKKAVELMNTLDVEDYDFDSEGILYINVKDNEHSISVINKVCGLLHLDRYGIFRDIRAWQKEFCTDPEPQIDLVFLISYLVTPKKADIFFHIKKGFSLKRRQEQFM